MGRLPKLPGATPETSSPEGTSVKVEVAYPCTGHETVTLERKLIHIRR